MRWSGTARKCAAGYVMKSPHVFQANTTVPQKQFPMTAKSRQPSACSVPAGRSIVGCWRCGDGGNLFSGLLQRAAPVLRYSQKQGKPALTSSILRSSQNPQLPPYEARTGGFRSQFSLPAFFSGVCMCVRLRYIESRVCRVSKAGILAGSWQYAAILHGQQASFPD